MTGPACPISGPHGHVSAGWEGVADAFSTTVPRDAGGAALSIWHEGREVIALTQGIADVGTGRAWQPDTPTVLFSATKGLAAVTVAHLVQDGHLEWDRRVADFWPEFAAEGKEALTVGDVLAHRAGLVALTDALSVDDLINNSVAAARLATQAPLWPVASAHLYHAVTWGPLVSEIVRRACGREIAEVFAEQIAAPLGADVRLAATADQLRRVAQVTNTPELDTFSTSTIPLLGEMVVSAMTAGGALPLGLVGEGTGLNNPRILASGLVSAGGVGTASGLAKVWAATVSEVDGSPRLLSPETIQGLTRARSTGAAFGEPGDGSASPRWGAGVQIPSASLPFFSPASFGHDGAGGQCAFADPDAALGFGYVTNRLSHAPLVPPILDAVHTVLGG